MVKLFGNGIGDSVYESTNDITNTTNQICSIRNKIRNSYTKRSTQGFTLAEMLIVIFIFTVITGGVVANFRIGQRSTELRLAAERIASALRDIQNMAQTGKSARLGAGDPQVPLGGYGARITADGFLFFADANANKQYDSGEELSDILLDMPTVVRVIRVEPENENNEVEIIFKPPLPEVYINSCTEAPCPAEARITIEHIRTEQTRTIIARRISGRIYVE